MRHVSRYLVLLTVATVGFVPPASAQIMYVYLTWQGDTGTTMTVNWQARSSARSAAVYYDSQPHDQIDDYPNQIKAESQRIDSRGDIRFVQHAELTGLTPGGTYYIQVGDKKNGFSRVQKFHTIPDTDEPIRFATGGDMDETPRTLDLVKVAASQEPAFVAVGGDIAYVNGNPRLIGKWDSWFKIWTENCITPDGYTLPLVLAIGNHEVWGQFNKTPEQCPYYFGFFNQAPTSYFSRTFGKNFVLFVLDSSHAAHHKDQVPWLERQFIEHQDIKYKFAIYHVPLYSSVRPETGEYETRGHTYWLPLFDKYHLTTAFENHDHALKRTKLLKGEKVDPTGTLYLGDGCFGQEPRVPTNVPRWYMAHTDSAAHVWIVDVTKDKITYRALGCDGEQLDMTTTPPE